MSKMENKTQIKMREALRDCPWVSCRDCDKIRKELEDGN